jgi:hypothetical protein
MEKMIFKCRKVNHELVDNKTVVYCNNHSSYLRDVNVKFITLSKCKKCKSYLGVNEAKKITLCMV